MEWNGIRGRLCHLQRCCRFRTTEQAFGAVVVGVVARAFGYVDVDTGDLGCNFTMMQNSPASSTTTATEARI